MPAPVQSVNKHVNGNQVILNVLAACNCFSYTRPKVTEFKRSHYTDLLMF